MRRLPVVLACILLAMAAATVGAQAAGPIPGVELAATTATGAVVSSAAGNGALPQPMAAAAFGMLLGDRYGLRLEAGALVAGPSALSSAWYRYRGFYGVFARAGAFVRFDVSGIFASLDDAREDKEESATTLATLSVAAGIHLERYDNSDTLFMHPGLDLAVTLPVLALGNGLRLDAGFSIPMLFRADCATLGFAATLSLAWAPAPRTADGRMDR